MPTDRLNRLILNINRLTEVEIVPTNDDEGWYWEWRCAHGEVFKSEDLALIDWIQRICKDYENLLVEVNDDDSDDEVEDSQPMTTMRLFCPE